MGECNTNGGCCCNHHNGCSCASCQGNSSGHDEHNHDDLSSYWFEVADEAWSEVLKENIKEHIRATQNDRMKELAKIVSEANNQRWKHKMEKKHGCDELHEKLSNFFGQKR